MNSNYTARLLKIEEILTTKLPFSYTKKWSDGLFNQLPKSVSDIDFNNLTTPCRDLLLMGGKRWRPLLLVLCAEIASGTKNCPIAYNLTPLVELIHTASLIHDDIEDSADMRRGKPAAHITYGIDTAINAGSFLYFTAFECIESATNDAILQNALYSVVLTELRRLHLGQAMDISWHKNNSFIPSVEQYSAMVRLKTGTLASLAAKTGILAGGGTKEDAQIIGELAADIGVGFQIIDDVINLSTGNKGKKRGDDIVEGKKSLPVILHIQSNPQDMSLLKQYFEQAHKEGPDSIAVENFIEVLTTTHAIENAAKEGRKLILSACNSIEERFSSCHSDVISSVHLLTELFTDMLV